MRTLIRGLAKAFKRAPFAMPASEKNSASAERGSIAAVFAVIAASGVLVGLIALAFDTGVVYQEQQTLRVASSAAAKGLADKCALGTSQCASPTAAASLVQQILNSNSADGVSAIDEVCGVSPLNACAPLTARSQDCKAITPGSNYVRVTAKTQTPTTTGILSVFKQLLGGTEQAASNTQLWSCSQAVWTGGGSGCAAQGGCSSTDQIMFNILFPACSYPGNDTPFVAWKFRNQGNNPNPPREADCSFTTQNGTVALTDVANGFAPFFENVGACNVAITRTTGDVDVFDDSNLRFYCGGNNSSFENYVNPKIANLQSIRVALAGTFVKTQPNRWDIKVLGFSNFQYLGYRLSNNQTGGATPPGGWAAYPPGVNNNDRCTASRDCFYGKYTSAPTFLPTPITVRLVP